MMVETKSDIVRTFNLPLRKQSRGMLTLCMRISDLLLDPFLLRLQGKGFPENEYDGELPRSSAFETVLDCR